MTINQLRLFMVPFKLAANFMRNCSASKITLLVFLIFSASSPALAADQQTQAGNLQLDQIHRGDQITVYDKSGRVFELIVEATATPDKLEPDTGLTGTYISDITDNENKYFRKANHRKLVITFKQDDKIIAGKVDSLADGFIEGTREGDTIKFLFYGVPSITSFVIRGEWKVNANGDMLEGSWKHPVEFASGKWNLARLDPVVATHQAGTRVIKGWLVSDHSAVEIRLTDIAKVEFEKPELTPESIVKAPAITQSFGVPEQECRISEEAIEAIENAKSLWNETGYTPGMYDLIMQAEAAARPPDCDNKKTIELAGQAKKLTEIFTESPQSVTSGEFPQTEADEKFPADQVPREALPTAVDEEPQADGTSKFKAYDGSWEFGLGIDLIDQPNIEAFGDTGAYGSGTGWIIGKDFSITENWFIGGQLQVSKSFSNDIESEDEVKLNATTLFATVRPRVIPFIQFKAGMANARYENKLGRHSKTGLAYGLGLVQGKGRVRLHFLDYQVYDLGNDKLRSFSISIFVLAALF
ncbi:MAG: hypothetical protein LJE92_19630 [Gammaproteobacteria bacterium]|jgi:hypothetical protein|nr:hypothetical protein [Gammaproteobacteria bacterium]